LFMVQIPSVLYLNACSYHPNEATQYTASHQVH